MTRSTATARPPAALVALVAALALACVASVAFGVRDVSAPDVLDAFLGHTDTASQSAAYVRIPRTVLAALVGAALAVAGTSMQAVTRNPLADPGIFGVLAGASLAVVVSLAVVGPLPTTATMAVAVLGSAAAAFFVYAVGSVGRDGATPLKLALSGAAVTAALTSLVQAVSLPRAETLEAFRFWQIGGVGGADWHRIGLGAPALLAGFLLCWACATGLNALALGDDAAAGLGQDVRVTRLTASVGAVVLCGVATALAGPIAFVGLVVPHACRLVIGTDHRWLVPVSAVAGACLLVVADTLGRVVVPSAEVAVGVITPLIGAPVFIWLVRSRKVRAL